MARDHLKRKTKKPKGKKPSPKEEDLPSKRPKLETSVPPRFERADFLTTPPAKVRLTGTQSKAKKSHPASKKADVHVPQVPSPSFVSSKLSPPSFVSSKLSSPSFVSSKLSSPSDTTVPNSTSARTSFSSFKSTSPLITKKMSDKNKSLVAAGTQLEPARERASQHWIEHAGVDRPRGLTKSFIGNDEQKEVLKFHATDSLGPGDWPEISFGQSGPMPRWRLREVAEDPTHGRDLHKDLIRTHKKRTHIRNVDQDHHPKSGDSSVGLGTLCWIFEPGPSASWRGLSHEQLYEFAYLCLVDALNDFRSRDMIRATIKRAKLESIFNVEDPLPPPPPPPSVTYFGPRAGVAEWPKIPPQMKGGFDYHYAHRYFRPSMAVREGSNTLPKTYSKTDQMRFHMKGTLRNAGDVCDSFDATGSLPPESVFGSGNGRKSSLSKEWDPEKDAREDFNRNPRLGEQNIRAEDMLKTGGHASTSSDHASIQQSDWSVQPSASSAPQSVLSVEPNPSFVEETASSVKKSASSTPTPQTVLSTQAPPRTSSPLHKDAIKLSKNIDAGRAYFNKCKEICENPIERQKYFPEPEGVRRVRTWGGSNILPSQANKWNLPATALLYRPFSSLKTRQKKSSAKSPSSGKAKGQIEKPKKKKVKGKKPKSTNLKETEPSTT